MSKELEIVELGVGLSGRYRFEVRKDGKTLRKTGWCKNLITNLGMNMFTTSTQSLDWCQVGSSSATPAFTDVALGSRIAGVATSGYATTIDTTNRYAIVTSTFTFSAGAAAGNIAEVGVGSASTGGVLFSRALVLDSMGNPTTITVLAGEDLVVIYQLWVKQPIGDFSSTVGVKTLTIRAANVNTISANGWIASNGPKFQAIGRGAIYAYTGAIGAITGLPTGSSSATVAITNDAYTADSWTRVSRFTFETGAANFAILSFSWGFGVTYWQAQLSSAITKTNTQTFRLGVRLTWSRDSGPA